MPIPGDIRARHIRDMLSSSGINADSNEPKLNGNPVIEVPVNADGRKDTAFITLISGLMVCTGSRELVKGAGIQAVNCE